MGENWDEYAKNWDNNPSVIEYSDKAFRSLCKLLNLDGLNILDFGCGTGLLTERMAPLAEKTLGLDPAEKMISVLKSKRLNKVDVLVAELSEEIINSNPLLQSKFDLIVASSVCAFVSEYEDTVRLLKSLLKPNGIFVQWDWLQTDKEPKFGFTEEMIYDSFHNVSFEIIKIERAFSLKGKNGEMQVLMGVGKNS